MIDTSSNMLYHISNLNDESYRISYQTASGEILENGSDDSLLHKDLIDLDDKLRVTQSLKLQLEKTTALNDVADTSLGDVKDGIETIRNELMKALNDGLDRSDKTALSTSIEGIRETLFDRLNTQVDDEYVFAGSVPGNQTMTKDEDFDLNGKVSFGGDGFLREIAVQPGTYRDRGVTAYDVAFYNKDSANSGETLSFEEGDRIIDSDGNEWKFNDNKNRLQKYDYNGIKIEPVEEINVKIADTSHVEIELDIGNNVDAKGDYVVKIEDDSGTHTYSYTATGTLAGGYSDSIDEIFNDPTGLLAQIQNDYPSAKVNGNKIVIDTYDEDSTFKVSISDTDDQYTIMAKNEQEAVDSQSTQNTYEFVVPVSYEGQVFESKHNYFDDLNRAINALDGYTTKLDGSKGPVASDDVVDDIIRTVLDQTSLQYDASSVGHGELGGRNKIFEVASSKIAVQETHYDLLSIEWGSSDKTKLALESKALDLTYQSLFSTISKMNNMSLVNFIN